MSTSITDLLGIAPWPSGPGVLFLAMLTVLAGALLGELAFRAFGLSRTLGYGVTGAVLGLLGLVDAAPLEGLARLVVDLALALLLFELGSRVDLHWLRANPALLWASVLEALLAFAALAAGLCWAGQDLAAALATAAVLACPSAGLADRVAVELGPKGQVTDRMLVLTAINTVASVLAVKLVIGGVHVGRHADWLRGIVWPLYTLAGSLAAAMVLYRLAAWILRHLDLRDEGTAVVMLALLLLATSSVRLLGLSTILVPLMAGLMLRNLNPRPCLWPRHFGSAGGVLVLMLFALVGTVWAALPSLVMLFGLAAALLAGRCLAKALVLVVLARPSGIVERQACALALTLAPVSAPALVLLAEVQATQPALAAAITPLVLAAVALMVVLGPLALQGGLMLARELGPHRRPAAP